MFCLSRSWAVFGYRIIRVESRLVRCCRIAPAATQAQDGKQRRRSKARSRQLLLLKASKRLPISCVPVSASRKMEEKDQTPTPQPTQHARTPVVGVNPAQDAANFAGRISKIITQYPHQLRTEPPLPRGFVEGALVGAGIYMLSKPIRSAGARFLNAQQGPMAKNLFGFTFFALQLTVSAQAALYAASHKGSYEWLQIAAEYASAESSDKNMHKSILGDEICVDPVVQRYLKDPRIASLPTTTEDPTLMEWVQDPEKIMVEELFRAVKACRSRYKD